MIIYIQSDHFHNDYIRARPSARANVTSTQCRECMCVSAVAADVAGGAGVGVPAAAEVVPEGAGPPAFAPDGILMVKSYSLPRLSIRVLGYDTSNARKWNGCNLRRCRGMHRVLGHHVHTHLYSQVALPSQIEGVCVLAYDT